MMLSRGARASTGLPVAGLLDPFVAILDRLCACDPPKSGKGRVESWLLIVGSLERFIERPRACLGSVFCWFYTEGPLFY